MPLTCDEIIETVAVLIARRRLHLPARAYTAADAIDDNALGWEVELVASPVMLPPTALDTAWTLSNRMLHAWA